MKIVWEKVEGDLDNTYVVYRARVPGGWIYLTTHIDWDGLTTCFVPDYKLTSEEGFAALLERQKGKL